MSNGTALKGKHAFITGGGHGIGGASAEVLAANGAKLTLTGRNMKKLEDMAATLPGAEARQLDVTDEDAVKRVFAEAAASLGDIDILINNSGIAETAPLAVCVRAKIYRIQTGEEVWLNYPRIFEILRSVNYNGFVSVVYEGQAVEAEKTAVPKAVDYLRRFVGQ